MDLCLVHLVIKMTLNIQIAVDCFLSLHVEITIYLCSVLIEFTVDLCLVHIEITIYLCFVLIEITMDLCLVHIEIKIYFSLVHIEITMDLCL